ncbi:unnamed protein product [Litomosoides sigmodontis]|uniref:Cleavage/polyadenylation specificity factor A subunit C-terminal domain-containing protein n=1 Tax=Litomosoides sigmodontis TaxID=42156 RepID=A0A3P6UV05_LITSI|nr:unnamed protein product [Litomosoides sigmodontis]
MYAILHETDDSTAVNFSECGKFFPEKGLQVATVGVKYLRIFRANPYALLLREEQQWAQTTRLECLLAVRLLAPVQSFAVARIPQNPDCDSLLLGFDDAKLSIIGVNPADRCLKTISLHCFEDELMKDGFTKNLPRPVIRVDPGQRCCAMLVFGRYLAVLPFNDSSSQLHSYTVQLSQIDSRLVNVMDMVFLDGYYEPTLLFLYEPVQTTCGRACVRYDTMCVLGVSLNVKEQVHASVFAVPRPVGGILIVAINELIYLNQSVPPCGISLNSCMDGYTKFPLKDFKHMALTLDGCVVTVISTNKILLCDRNGRVFMLLLVTDATNSVKSLELKFQFETVIPCTMTSCTPGYLFIGSRLCDSVFLHCIFEQSTMEECSAKKIKLNAEPNVGEEDEDFELYGEVLPKVTKTNSAEELLNIRVLDKLLNIGPCKKITGGCPSISAYFQETPRKDPLFDLVCACGHGKFGSICILQRSIRPEIITSSSIEGVVQYWAVGRREDDTHMYFIASRELGTLALETDNDLVELEAPIFATSESTIAAGELADGGLAVQVTTSSLVMVAEGQQIQYIPLQLTFPVRSASIVDPYIAICTQNGRLLMYELTSHPHVHLKEIDIPKKLRHETSPITSLSIYRDMSGIIRFCSTTNMQQQQQMAGANVPVPEQEDFEDVDDFLLYGNSKKFKKDTVSKRRIIGMKLTEQNTHFDTDVIDPNTIVPSHWIVIARENGNIYIYSIPELHLVYMIKKISHLPDVATDQPYVDDEPVAGEGTDTMSGNIADTFAAKPEEVIMEVLLVGMGMNQGRPMLLLLIDDAVSVYEMFTYNNGIQGHLAVRFKRLPYTTVTRSCRFQGPDGRAAVESVRDAVRHKAVLHFFERIGNVLNGVFICSSYPCIFFLESGIPRLHPVNLDGPILSFTTFNNAACPNGFIYLTERDRLMRVAKLPSDMILDASYPVRRINVGATVHNVIYLLHSNTYAVLTSEKKKVTKMCVLINDDKTFEEHEKPDTFVYPEIDQYKLHLYSPENWKPVQNVEILFEEFEVVTSCEEVVLRSEGTVSGVQNYLAVGTACNYGEEVLVRGRIIISEIIEVVPEPGQPTSKHRIKTLYDKEQKGPVTSLCSCNGYLLTGMGQKVFIWLFKDNNLQGISFLDMHFYVHQLIGVRNLALACDMYRSVALLRYQEEYKALSLASRDMRSDVQPPMSAQFIIDNKQMGFVMSDEAANIAIFNYLPETLESLGGEKLTLRAEINIGTVVNSFIRVKGHVSSGFVENELFSLERQTVLFASLDGSLGYIRPLTEKNTRNLVDGDMVMQYLHLSLPEKNDLARKLGTSRYHIIDDLIEICRVTAHY